MKKQKGSKLGQYTPLSKVQKSILDMLTREYLTPLRVAQRRGTSLKAVYKTIKILERKGVLNLKNKKVQNVDHTITYSHNKKIRLHAQHFTIKLISKGNKYNSIRTNSNMFKIDNNTIKLHDQSIEVYSNNSFYGDDPNKADFESVKYWNRFFIRLESELDIIIVKDRHKNIKLVQNHYAETNNELAEQSNLNKDKIRVFSTQDTKMWFEIDNSFNLNEAETTHPQTAKADMQNIIQPFFNDLRDNPSKLPSVTNAEMSQLFKLVNSLAVQTVDIAKGLNIVVKLITPKQPITEPTEQTFKVDYVG